MAQSYSRQNILFRQHGNESKLTVKLLSKFEKIGFSFIAQSEANQDCIYVFCPKEQGVDAFICT